ncbi:hypothetical protein M0R45_005474 [Rubus argutus]|uniref:Uncharacterized protein n=1 Tax=Rubus argutus TaxID=59490 RepID=A0AAW1YMT0_RUBAR
MQIPRWRNVLILKNSLISSTSTATHFASFHSTPASCEKWKDKWNFSYGIVHAVYPGPVDPGVSFKAMCNLIVKRLSDEKSSEQPSKNFIRYATRHKRADAKKALKNLLFNSGYSPKISYEHIQKEDDSGSSPKNHRSKSRRHAQKSHHKKMKCKLKRESFS